MTSRALRSVGVLEWALETVGMPWRVCECRHSGGQFGRHHGPPASDRSTGSRPSDGTMMLVLIEGTMAVLSRCWPGQEVSSCLNFEPALRHLKIELGLPGSIDRMHRNRLQSPSTAYDRCNSGDMKTNPNPSLRLRITRFVECELPHAEDRVAPAGASFTASTAHVVLASNGSEASTRRSHSATIRNFSSTRQRRRRSTPVMISIRSVLHP